VIFAAFDLETVSQLTANGMISGAFYGLLGVGFALILGVTGRFHFAYSIYYTLSAYFMFTFWDRVGLPVWPAVLLGILAATALGVGTEQVIYRPMAVRAGATALLAIFVASLGLTIAGSNLVQLLWGSENQILEGPQQDVINWGDVAFLNFDLWSVLSSFALVLILSAVMRWTDLGRQIKATRVNPELAEIIGISAHRIYLIVFAIGTFLSGVAAFWFSLKFSIDPAMGLRPVIFAFVVAFLAGTASSPLRVFLTGIAIALIEQYASIWLSTRWTQTAVFVVLLVYLVVLAFEPRRVILGRFPQLAREKV